MPAAVPASTSGARRVPGRIAEDGLRSVSISVAVLRCFTEHEILGPTQVAGELGIAKSTASRMLSALATGGLLERDTAGRYRLSLGVWSFGRLAVDRLPVRAHARPVMIDLADSLREAVQLGIPDSGYVLYVERVGTGGCSRLAGEVLRRVPAYSSSSGRVMAAVDPALAQALWQVPRQRHTPYTIADSQRLAQVLRGARTLGWVSSRDECEVGLSSVAAPVVVREDGRLRAVAALSVVGPTARLGGPRKEFFAAALTRAARTLSEALASS